MDDGDEGMERWADDAAVERAVLAETPEGRVIAAEFVATFGAFVSQTVRPLLREVSEAGGEPQLLVNGLAELMRSVAGSLELPAGERQGSPADRADPR